MRAFDPAAARALPHNRWLTFPGYPGLRLNRSGDARSWTYRYRSSVDGRLRQIRLGRWPAVSWEKAVARWDELRHKRDDGIDPQLDRRTRRAEARERHAAERKAKQRRAVTVEKLVRTFLAEHIAKECRTEKAKYEALRIFEGRVLPALGLRPAHLIDRADAANFLSLVKIEAPSMAMVIRSRLGGVWDHAIARKLLPSDHVNPWRDALRGKLKAKTRTRFLDDAELATFLAKVRTLEDAEVRDALLLTLLTAARSGEVVGMDPDAVDLKRGTWTLTSTKADAPRTIRLPRQAAAILKARGRGFAITQKQLGAALREAQPHFGLKTFTAHDLRRSARIGLSRLGIRDEVAEAALGHVQGGIRGTYNLHAYEREIGEALQKWCDHLDALQAPEVVPMSSTRRRSA